MRRLLQVMLSREGYQVEPAASIAAAVRALRDTGPERRSVVLYEATRRWDQFHDAPRFFTAVTRHASLRRHRFVLLTSDVQVLPEGLRDVLVPLADRVLPISFDIQTLLDALAAATAVAPAGYSGRTGMAHGRRKAHDNSH
jgi:hypothetical protein